MHPVLLVGGTHGQNGLWTDQRVRFLKYETMYVPMSIKNTVGRTIMSILVLIAIEENPNAIQQTDTSQHSPEEHQ